MSLIKISVHDILLAGLEFVSLENLFQPILIKYTKTGKNFIISTIPFLQSSLFYLFTLFIYILVYLFSLVKANVIYVQVSFQTFNNLLSFVIRSYTKVTFFFRMRFNDALSGLRQFLVTENPLKMMKNAIYFTLKALFALKIFTFLSSLFGHFLVNGLIRKVS